MKPGVNTASKSQLDDLQLPPKSRRLLITFTTSYYQGLRNKRAHASRGLLNIQFFLHLTLDNLSGVVYSAARELTLIGSKPRGMSC